MAATFHPYTEPDYLLIRDFLSQYPSVWWIDRLNFTSTVSAGFHATTREAWARRIGLWRDQGQLLAVVLGEGEGHGETFLLAGPDELEATLVRQIFDFVETTAEVPQGREKPEVHLRLSTSCRRWAVNRTPGLTPRPSSTPGPGATPMRPR